ncbi:TIGR02147 family protein [Bdellovibrio sp. 22V]|uniref:TIGR02147 family protein n=1 Tax=Bdellovibrio TaxID=958 RepID=UPI0025434A08|nr:TIGR02147 family protein [Bdellovibrio sp. 22V]WII70945.1 TIGR02147 family protein [Bdellovibrio sp. 22V]
MAKHHYRDYILKELERRQRKNPSYSLRAYARDLEVPCSRLSEILNGKVGLSETRAMNLATKLNLSPSEKDFFVDLALAEHARSAVLRSMAAKRVQARKEALANIGEEQFSVISDWYHLAIIETLRLHDFNPTVENLSKKLGVAEDLIEKALERLAHLNLITKNQEGQWVPTSEGSVSTFGQSYLAVRNYHNQLVEKSNEAMDPTKGKKWDKSSLLIPVNHQRSPELVEKIRAFRAELMTEVQSMEARDSVYCLTMSFFELTERA